MEIEELKQMAKEVGAFIESQLIHDEAKARAGATAYGVDISAEEFLKSQIADRGVKMGLLLEDTEPFEVSGDKVLIADVLDGSANAVRSVPLYNVCLAVGSERLWSEYRPEHVNTAVVYNPATHVMHWAKRGEGAFRNDRRLKIMQPEAGIEEWHVGAIYGHTGLEVAMRVLRQFGSHRVFGCASEHICGVARGDFDLYLGLNDRLRAVDIAAAVLIAQEAGCEVVNTRGYGVSTGARDHVSVVVAPSRSAARHAVRILNDAGYSVA